MQTAARRRAVPLNVLRRAGACASVCAGLRHGDCTAIKTDACVGKMLPYVVTSTLGAREAGWTAAVFSATA
eukprot:178030-Chlamydomonas_euryale.AAC.20